MGKYIILFGGQLFNKGAQAMTFIVVDEMAKRFPNHKVILLSTKDFNRDEKEKDRYRFDIVPFPRYRILFLAAFSKKVQHLKTLLKNDENIRIVELFHNADYVLDISGYSLGSDWGCDISITYCLRMKLAKMCGAKVYLMPQSFGPFNYTGKRSLQTEVMIKKCLPCANLIMAREREGFTLLKNKYGLNNVVLANDMVLQNRNIDMDHIYKDRIELAIPLVSSHSIGIIPNTKIFRFGDSRMIYSAYDAIVSTLIKHKKEIYFLIHCSDDRELCEILYKRYSNDNDRIHLVEEEMSCLEFDKTVNKFDFIIASRYHTIVHAYRNAVPAIVLSWATKYKELMQTFDQDEFIFNVRHKIEAQIVCEAIEHMISKKDIESAKIEKKLLEIRKNNVFDYVK